MKWPSPGSAPACHFGLVRHHLRQAFSSVVYHIDAHGTVELLSFMSLIPPFTSTTSYFLFFVHIITLIRYNNYGSVRIETSNWKGDFLNLKNRFKIALLGCNKTSACMHSHDVQLDHWLTEYPGYPGPGTQPVQPWPAAQRLVPS